jgi:iron complex transport system ATP-binding protein
MLRLEHFSFAFPARQALDDIHFSLEKGAFLFIIGPNGAGKSTLLKCLLRLHEKGRTRGEIFLDGRPLSSRPQRELARLISYVPQAGGWIPPFTVREFLRLSRYPHTPPGIRPGAADADAVERALALTGMAGLAGRFLKNLSGGERQKAFLAAALAQDTEIMLLDEPASFLDPRHTSELNRLLKSLNREQGLTMLTVTHDLNQPLDAGGQVLALREGKQVFFGSTEELPQGGVMEKTYAHSFTLLQHPRTGRPAVLPD